MLVNSYKGKCAGNGLFAHKGVHLFYKNLDQNFHTGIANMRYSAYKFDNGACRDGLVKINSVGRTVTILLRVKRVAVINATSSIIAIAEPPNSVS
jgi:hypothetical protein